MTSTYDSTMIDEAINQAARKLHQQLHDGTYEGGHEDVLAAEVIAPYDAALRLALLVDIIHAKMNDLITVDCLLDECDPQSYEVVGQMGRLLIAELERQGNVDDPLKKLVVRVIVDRSEYSSICATSH